MKTLLLKSRWFLLLPLAAGVAFVVQLNVVNRMYQFIDDKEIDAYLHRQVLQMLLDDTNAGKNREVKLKKKLKDDKMPGIVRQEGVKPAWQPGSA